MRLFLLFVIFFLFNTLVVLAQSNGDFRSRQSGNWSDSDTWEEFDGSIWVNTANVPDFSSGAILVQNDLSIISSISVDQTTVSNNGTLNISSGATLSINAGPSTDLIVAVGSSITINGSLAISAGFGSSAQVLVEGTVFNNGNISGGAASRLSFGSTSIYEHQVDNGSIPSASWNAESVCLITGSLTGGPSNLGQSFGNLIWDTPNLSLSGLWDMGLTNASSFSGDLTILDTGLDILVFSDLTINISINGDLNINGNSSIAITNTGDVTINVSGNLNYNSSFDSYFSNIGTGVINLTGDFVFSNGTFSIFDISGSGELAFVGTGDQVFNNDMGGFFNGAGESPDFLISSGSTVLMVGESNFNGTGDFTIESGGVLGVSSVNPSGAIQNNSSSGNIRVTGTRTFNTGATLIYNGTSTQFLGNGFPTSGDVNLTIDNPTEVILDQDLTINSLRTLTKQQGILDLGSVTTTINGTIINNGGAARGDALATLIINADQFDPFTLVEDQRLLNLTVNPGTGNSFIQGSDINVLGDFTHSSGNYVFNDHKLVLGGNVNITSGSYNSNSNSTLVINGTGTLDPISFNSGSALDTLTIARAGSNLSTNSSFSIDVLNLTDGTLNNTGTITIADGGSIYRSESGVLNNAVNAATSYDIYYTNSTDITTGVELPSGSSSLDSLIFEGSGVVTLNKATTVNGAIIVDNGTFNASSFNVQLAGNLINNSNAILNGSTFTFIGNSEVQSVTPPVFDDLVVNSDATANIASGSINIEGNLTNNGTFTSAATTNFTGTTSLLGSNAVTLDDINITPGSTLTASASETTINGDFTNEGTFDPNNGTIVFGGTSNILGSANPQFYSIRIEGTLNGPGILDLTKDFTNNGTFVAGSNTVEFNGTATQFVSGTSETVFHDIDVNNTAGPPAVSINGTASLQGILTITNTGTEFDADGSGSGVFTVLSNATGDGGINTIPSGSSISGNVTVQRFLQSYGRSFRYFAPTVTNATVADWQDDISVTGSFTGASPGSSFHSLLFYNETISGTINDGFTEFPSTSNTESFVPGRGYTAYIWEGQSDIIVDVRGPINQGSINLNVTYNSTEVPEDDGWNLVANAYPGVVDWQVIYDDPSTQYVGPQIAVRDESANGSFAYYDASTGEELNGGSRNIAMGQSFWVQTISSSPILVLNESFKTTNSATFLKSDKNTSKTMKIALSNASQRDETSLNITPEATSGYDPGLDFKKFNNDGFDLSTLTKETKDVAINHIGIPDCSESIFLNVKDVTDGTYQLSFEGVNSFDPHKVSLIDRYSGEIYEVNDELSISFEVNTNDSSSFGNERFELVLDEVIIPDVTINSIAGCNETNGQIVIENASEKYEYFIYDEEGNKLFEATGNNNPIFYELDSGMHDTVLSVYMNSIGCDNQVLIENRSVARNNILPEITQEGTTLISNYVDGNQWYYEGELLTNENNQSLIVDKPGVYKLEVTQGSCSSFIEYEFRITSVEINTNEINVFPNPFNNIFSIQLNDDWDKPEIAIYRNDGALISSRNYTVSSNGIISIDGKDLIQGVYHLIITEKNNVIKRKIVKF
jgi:hypothetical protein